MKYTSQKSPVSRVHQEEMGREGGGALLQRQLPLVSLMCLALVKLDAQLFSPIYYKTRCVMPLPFLQTAQTFPLSQKTSQGKTSVPLWTRKRPQRMQKMLNHLWITYSWVNICIGTGKAETYEEMCKCVCYFNTSLVLLLHTVYVAVL